MKFIYAILVFMAFLVIKPPGQTFATVVDKNVSFVADVEQATPAVNITQEKGGELFVLRYSNIVNVKSTRFEQPAGMTIEPTRFIHKPKNINLMNTNSKYQVKKANPLTLQHIQGTTQNLVAIYLTKIGSATSV